MMVVEWLNFLQNKFSMRQTFNLIILIISVMSIISCSGLNKNIINNNIKLPVQNCIVDELYKVESISIYRSIYVIKFSRNDSIFEVLTEYTLNPLQKILVGDSFDKNCNSREIEVGESYQIKLDKLCEYKLEKNAIPNGGVKHLCWYGGIYIELKINQIYYTTNNLIGLCLIKSEK